MDEGGGVLLCCSFRAVGGVGQVSQGVALG